MDSIINYYSKFDEWGRLDREPLEFIVNWHYIQRYLPGKGKVLDNGAGPGRYAMKLAQQGYAVTLADLVPKQVEFARDMASNLNIANQFDGFHVADARNLSAFDDGQFDAALALGPMYHLQLEQDRHQAMKELYRVTKSEGIVFVAFMPRIRHVLSSLLQPEHWRPNDNIDSIQQFMSSGDFNHSDEGRFTRAYYFEIDDIKPFMESHGFETLNLIGSNIGTLFSEKQWEYWVNRGKEEFSQFITLLTEKASDPYLLGVSSHLLYIGKKTG